MNAAKMAEMASAIFWEAEALYRLGRVDESAEFLRRGVAILTVMADAAERLLRELLGDVPPTRSRLDRLMDPPPN
jgi:hypothetical protein